MPLFTEFGKIAAAGKSTATLPATGKSVAKFGIFKPFGKFATTGKSAATFKIFGDFGKVAATSNATATFVIRDL